MTYFFHVHLAYLTMTLGMTALGLLGWLHLAESRRDQPQNFPDLPSPNQFFLLVFFTYLAGIFGAKLAAILWNLPRLVKGASLLQIWRGAGLVSFGGYLGAIAAIIIYSRLKVYHALKVLDIFCAYLGAFDVFQRLGCIAIGCCRGQTVMDTPGWFINRVTLGLGLARHPFPFYMMLFAFALLTIMARAIKKPHRPGEIFLRYFMIYSAGRFCLEFLREEPVLTWLKPLTAPQAVCVVILVTAFIAKKRMGASWKTTAG